MDTTLDIVLGSLLAPTILFFILGLVAAVSRSDLSIPEGAAKVMSIYLLFVIGFKGGVSIAHSGFSGQLISSLIAGALLSFVLPFLAFGLLRIMTHLDATNAAAVAGHYGSISIVTFVTAVNLTESLDISSEGYLVAVAAVMEVPAIISALWLVARHGTGTKVDAALLHHILGNGSIVLLIGSFSIGAVTGQDGLKQVSHFIEAPFVGVLCIFLLDMGLTAGRNLLTNYRDISLGVVAFGIVMPLVSSLVGLSTGIALGLSIGGVFLLMVLCASASYIAVPAAMKLALPQANSGVYLTLSLGITFPFNLALGLPIYLALAERFAGS